MKCQEVSGNWVFLPSRKAIGIIHFLGGAFVATAPQISYRSILEHICEKGFVVIATPFVNTFNHFKIARDVLNGFETTVERLKRSNLLSSGYIPTYGVGHSMGCKLHLLISSLYDVERIGNILISFNNYPAKQAVPFLEQLNIPSTLDVEFEPSPEETKAIITKNYNVRRNLLVKFNDDNLDQTILLKRLLEDCSLDMVTAKRLRGNHLTPLKQKMKWQMGEIYTPIDAIGQWFNQGISKNLNQLTKELIVWLDPMSAF
ncbi:MAG: DUF1350 family protein [Pleurocapsa sp.]